MIPQSIRVGDRPMIRTMNIVFPRTIFFYFAILVLLNIKPLFSLIGFAGSSPENVANAVAEGLVSVLKDDDNLKSLDMFGSKNGKNDAGTVELLNYSTNWTGMFGGGVSAAGGKLVFHDFKSHGVAIQQGTLDMKLSNERKENSAGPKFQLQGTVKVSGIEEPVQLVIEFVSLPDDPQVTVLKGKVSLNGKVSTIE